MSPKNSATARIFLTTSHHYLQTYHLPRILKCLKMLSAREIWWRPNAHSNSVGNLVLHLSGNVRQWIIGGLGGAPDLRDRDHEFAERGSIPPKELAALLRGTVREACSVLRRLPEDSLTRNYQIQGFHVTGLYAVYQVVEHFSHHAGQIIFVTKLKRGKDLSFTRLPAVKHNKSAA